MSHATDTPVSHGSYPALSRPLTLLGCDRRLFLGAACVGAAAFSSFSAPLAVLLRSASCSSRYDPALRSTAPDPLEIVGEVP